LKKDKYKKRILEENFGKLKEDNSEFKEEFRGKNKPKI
jgi:hypothetical protein